MSSDMDTHEPTATEMRSKVPYASKKQKKPASGEPTGTKKDGTPRKERKKRVLRADGTQKKKSNYDSFATFIYKILKQVHPEAGVSKKAMAVLNSLLLDLFDRIARQAGALAQANKKHTISAREVQTACRLVLQGEISTHAVSEGTKAVLNYESSKAKEQTAE